MAPKFSALRVLPGPAVASDAQSKKRRLSEMAVGAGLSPGDMKVPRGVARPASAPIELTVFRYGDRASDHLPAWPAAARVYQMQIMHEAAPSWVVNIVPAFNGYLEHLHSEDAGIPSSLSRLRAEWNMVLQIAKVSEPNPAGAPLVNWRVAFYVVGGRDELRDALQLVHGYVAFRARRPLTSDKRPFTDLGEQEFLVHFGPRDDLLALENAESPVVKVDHVALAAAPRSMLECAGPMGNKFLVAEVEVVGEEKVAIGWMGQTWGLRNDFEAQDIPLGEDGAGGYLRFINGDRGNVGDVETASRLVEVMGDVVLNRTPCLVRVVNAKDVVAGSKVEDFLNRLRALDHLVFV